MKTDANGERMNPDREIIDRMIGWRKVNRPTDTSDLKTNLNPEALHKALRMPFPANAKAWPDSVLYRGYRVLAKVKQKESA